jgi:hypothetical protein
VRTLLTVLTVFSREVRIEITRLPARPSRLNAMSIPSAKKCLRPTQVAGESAWILGPASAVLRNTLTAAFNANPQKIGGAAGQ